MTAEDVRALLRRCRSVPVGNMPRTGTPGKRHWAALPEAYALADLTRTEDGRAVLAAALPDAVCAGILALTGEVGNHTAGWYGYALTTRTALDLAVRAWADLDPFAAEAAATALLEHANKTRREEEKE